MLDISTPSFSSSRLKVGGTVGSGYLYVERQADRELFNALSQGEFCYVLAPRQIGKSSLRHRTAMALEAQGIRCAFVDLSGIGTSALTADVWYYNIIYQLALVLKLDDPGEYWHRNSDLTPAYRFSRYLREELVYKIQEPIVIFIDEIDTVISLPFDRDDFFAVIREVYNARADEPVLSRLSFCLLGVAAPYDLIRDETRTPFNIGKAIRLRDFTKDEAQEFLSALIPITDAPESLLEEIYRWTNGHPYMTQRLCESTINKGLIHSDEIVAFVKNTVDDIFIERGRADYSLSSAERYLRSDGPRHGQMLKTYKEILHARFIHINPNSSIQTSLLLSGLVAERQDRNGVWCLETRNAIFSAVFDEEWVKAQEAHRLLAEPLSRWLDSNRNPDELLRGQRLAEIIGWAKGKELTSDEHDFLIASMTEQSRKDIQARELRHQRRNKIIGIAAFIVLFGALVGIGWGYLEARRQQKVARQATIIEKSARASLLAKQPGRHGEALLVAMDAMRESLSHGHNQPRETYSSLYAAASKVVLSKGLALPACPESQCAPALSRDGKFFSLLLADGTAQVWDLVSQRLQFTLQVPHSSKYSDGWSSTDQGAKQKYQSHLARIRYVSFSPKAEWILTRTEDGYLQIWDSKDGHQERSIEQPIDMLYANFSSTGKYIITLLSNNHKLNIFDVQTGKLIFSTYHAHPYGSYTISLDDTKLLSTSPYPDISTVWDIKSGRSLLEIGRWNIVRSASFSADGKRLAVAYMSIPTNPAPDWHPFPGSGEPTAVWNLETGEHRLLPIKEAQSIEYSPDNRTVLVQDSYGLAYSIDSITEHINFSLRETYMLETVTFSPDGRYIISRARRPYSPLSPITFWDASSGQSELDIDNLNSARFIGNEGALWGTFVDGRQRIWDMRLGRIRLEFNPLIYNTSLGGVAFSSDGKKVISIGTDGSTIYNSMSGGILLNAKNLEVSITNQPFAFSADRERAVIGGLNGVTHILELRAGKILTALTDNGVSEGTSYHPIKSVDYSHNGQILSLKDNGIVHIWDGKRPDPITTIQTEPAASFSQFSPDGTHVITVSGNKIQRWDSGTGALNLTWEFGRDWREFSYAAESPDNKRIAMLREMGYVLVRDTNERHQIILKQDNDFVRILTFSPDSRLLATGSTDGIVRLWDVTTGNLLLSLEGHSGAVRKIAFSPDGKRILTLGGNNRIIIFNIDLDELISFGCKFLQQNSSDESTKIILDFCRQREFTASR